MKISQAIYAGFWSRVGATIIDTALLGIITLPLLWFSYGLTYWESEALFKGLLDLLISWVLPTIAIILFWVTRQATPGKMAFSARIVDAKTGRIATNRQLLVRYFAYLLSALPLCLGFLWVAFDKRKQGWHDKVAGTMVIRSREL